MGSEGTASLIARGIATVEIPNLLRYRGRAPRWSQRIDVNPAEVVRAVFGWRDRHSGQVVADPWPFYWSPVAELPKVRACVLHWRDGIPWEDTGVFDHMLRLIERHGKFDGCRTLADVRARYTRLDREFEQVRAEGRLRPRAELPGRSFRELGGVRIHLYQGGEPVFSGTGGHRLAMAQVLDFRSIPAQLGVLHPEVARNWR